MEIKEVGLFVGRDFEKKLSRNKDQDGSFFTDKKFNAKNIEVYGPGRTYVRVRAKNTIGFYGTDTLKSPLTYQLTARSKLQNYKVSSIPY